MAKIKVLLIEDNRLLRVGTTAMLNEQADISAVSSAGNRTAIEKAKKLKPDVVLLDSGLRSQDSLKVVASIKKRCPQAEVVVMDLIPSHSEMVEFVKAGVSGFILKDSTPKDLLHTIRLVVKGEQRLLAPMADSLFSRIVEHAIADGTADPVIDAVKLTKPEQDVIRALAEGKTVTEISRERKVAIHTVKNHIRNILDKLALHTRLELATFTHTKAPS